MNKEFRIKGGERVLNMIRQLSATEKVIFGILVVVLIASTLTLFAKVNESFLVQIPARGGALAEGVVGLPRLVNPVIAVSDVDRDLDALIYSGLMKYDHGDLVTDLAKKYSISDDGLTYTVTLKDNVYFQDGEPVTTDDVAFTIEKMQDPTIQSPRRVDWKDVTVKKNGATEIQFILKQPYAPFLNNLTIGILPKHIWKNVDANQFIFSQYNIEPIGSGPYRLKSIDRDSGGIPTAYRLAPFTQYQSGQTYISDLSIHFYPNEQDVVNALTSGNIDSVSEISSQQAAKIASSTPSARILSTPLPRIFAIFMNQNNTVLSNKEVRQALNLGVDKDRLVKTVLGGYGVRIDGPLPYSVSTNAATTTKSSDGKAAARALLEKNNWGMGTDGIYAKKDKKGQLTSQRLAFTIATADSADLKQTAYFVQKEWKLIGADVTVKVFESNDLTQDIIRNRKYDALLFGEVIGKGLDLYAFWHSSQRNAPGLNLSMYVNSKTDKLLDDARVATDESVRNQKYADFQKIIQDDAPATFLYSPDFIYVVPDKVKGLSLGQVTAAQDRWSDVSKWYTNTDNVWKIFKN